MINLDFFSCDFSLFFAADKVKTHIFRWNMAPQPDNIPPPKADFTAPPPYEAGDYSVVSHPIEPSKLPTYEEVQLEKSLHGEPIQPMQPQLLPPSICATGRQPHHTPNTGNVTFIAIADTTDAENITSDNSLLGTDIIFVTAFLIAFLFNWIGFLMLTCFCHTIAARYGALSGFGLSLAKWTLIVKHNTDLASENSWLWWLIMAFGFLICVRALVQYVSIKRTWRLLSASAQERLLFFY